MKYVFEKKKHTKNPQKKPCICELFLRHCVLGHAKVGDAVCMLYPEAEFGASYVV